VVVHLSVAWLAVLLGMLCNAMVTVANDGVMPVKGLPSGFKPLFPTWIPARPANHLVVLGDQQSLFSSALGTCSSLAVRCFGVGPVHCGCRRFSLRQSHPAQQVGVAGLLQLRVLRLGLLQDGNVGVGVFPEGEKIL
jgi:hypothetical protein